MLPILAGILAGAGALYAATEFSARQEENDTGGNFVAAELDTDGIKSKLNAYFWQASKLHQKCNEIEIKSCDVMMGSIELPDDNTMTRLGNRIYDTMLPVSRAMLLSQLKNVNCDCHDLLKKYAGVFKRANAILETNGKQSIFIKKRHVDNSTLVLNNGLGNEDWSDDFGAQVDRVRDFIEASYNAANAMIDALDTIDSEPCACVDNELKSLCA